MYVTFVLCERAPHTRARPAYVCASKTEHKKTKKKQEEEEKRFGINFVSVFVLTIFIINFIAIYVCYQLRLRLIQHHRPIAICMKEIFAVYFESHRFRSIRISYAKHVTVG